MTKPPAKKRPTKKAARRAPKRAGASARAKAAPAYDPFGETPAPRRGKPSDSRAEAKAEKLDDEQRSEVRELAEMIADEKTRREKLIGNQFWKQRSSHGRAPIFKTPEKLWTACVEYFEWVTANPLYEDTLVTFQGIVRHEPVAKMRAMTLGGLCIYLDIGEQTWRDYAKRKDYSGVTTRVEAIVRTQKFEGASGGFLNANIIARDLGLADKSELTGKNGGPVAIAQALSKMDDAQLEELIASMGAGIAGMDAGR